MIKTGYKQVDFKTVKQLIKSGVVYGCRGCYWINEAKAFLEGGSVSDFKQYISMNGKVYIFHYKELTNA